MPEPYIAIVDYGAGNLLSIYKALEKTCAESGAALRPVVTADPALVAGACAVVLPGVGAAAPTMERLRDCGLVEPLREAARDGRPFLGICLGLQLLFGHNEEGDIEGLGVLEGSVLRFAGGMKVPHMGWNTLHTAPHPMFGAIPQRSYFYFVHSYYAQPADPSLTVGTTEYGVWFCGAVARGNLWGVQFHPEKSGKDGLRLLSNFTLLAAGAGPVEPVAALESI